MLDPSAEFIDYETEHEWRKLEQTYRSGGKFDIAKRCQERADQIAKRGGYYDCIYRGDD